MNLNSTAKIILLLTLSLFFSGCTMTKSISVSENGDVMQVSSSQLMWQKERSPRFTSREKAENYANNLELGGYNDWRLPTKEELLNLSYAFDYGSASAKTLGIVIECNYWSANTDGLVSAGGLKDGDKCEIDRNFKPSNSGYVRAVRP